MQNSVSQTDALGNAGASWQVFVGPTSPGFPPGGQTASFITYSTYQSNAPVQFVFFENDIYQAGQSNTLSGQYDFTTGAFSTNADSVQGFLNAQSNPFTASQGVFAQVLLWGGDIGFDETVGQVTVTITGTTSAPLQIATNFLSPAAATTGKPYSASLTASGGTPPYTWFVTEIPAGLTVGTNADGTGAISGTPTSPSPDLPIDYPGVPPGIIGSSIGVQVRDSAGHTANRNYTIYVYGAALQAYQTQAEKNADLLTFVKDFAAAGLASALALEPPCDAIPPCFLTAGSMASSLAQDGISAYINALDPVDLDYKTLVTPPNVPVSLLTVSPQITQSQVAAVNALLQNVRQQTSLRWAIYQSINRAQGARQSGAAVWETEQLAQAKHFSYALANLVSVEAAIRSNVVTALGFQVTPTSAQLGAIYSSIASGQPSTTILDLLEKNGLSQVSIDQFTSLYASTPSSLVPPGFPSYLTGADLAASDQQSMQALRAFAADVNNDLQVNCADMAAIKAAFGSKAGEANYNPLADVNGDGIVNILDLSFVARQLPAGTACN